VQRGEADESEPSISRLREIAALTDEPLAFFIATDLSEEAVAWANSSSARFHVKRPGRSPMR
jgi:hypothetical protein